MPNCTQFSSLLLSTSLNNYLGRLTDWLLRFGPRILVGIAFLFIGFWLIRRLMILMSRLMARRHVDPSLAPFLRSVTSILLKIFLIISVLTMIGVNTASFITALGAAGLAIGLALQGSLANFAGGVLILLFKPFKVGDLIEAQGQKGVVREIQVLYTILHTADGKKVVIPNGNLSNREVVNFSAEPLRRVDFKLLLPYAASSVAALAILREIGETEELALKTPVPTAQVADLVEGGIKLELWVWVEQAHFGQVHARLGERIAERFREAKLPLGAPISTEVHLHQPGAAGE